MDSFSISPTGDAPSNRTSENATTKRSFLTFFRFFLSFFFVRASLGFTGQVRCRSSIILGIFFQKKMYKFILSTELFFVILSVVLSIRLRRTLSRSKCCAREFERSVDDASTAPGSSIPLSQPNPPKIIIIIIKPEWANRKKKQNKNVSERGFSVSDLKRLGKWRKDLPRPHYSVKLGTAMKIQ